MAGEVKETEACAAKKKRRHEELQDSSSQVGWATGMAFPMPG